MTGIDLRYDIRSSLWNYLIASLMNMLCRTAPYDPYLHIHGSYSCPGAWTPTLKNGEKIIPNLLYGCPEKYLTQEKTDEAHKTK
jgi:hypothetical protein